LVISFPNKSLFLLDFLYLTVLKLKLCEWSASGPFR
jgi:hypothetical protein